MTVTNMHFGRAWHGHEIEDICPCPKAPCGLVSVDPSVLCEQHNPKNPFAAKTMRQAHWPENCPAAERGTMDSHI